MSDSIPSGSMAVFGFFELFAAAFTIGGVEALLEGRPWAVWCPAVVFGMLCFLIGVKNPWLRTKFTAVDWTLWNRRINRAVVAVSVSAAIALSASGYFAWHEISQFWHELFKGSEGLSAAGASQPQIPQTGKIGPSVNFEHQRPSPSRSELLDWRNKGNWRDHLRVGMSRKEVRNLFGEPETVSVYETLEEWRYGLGDIQFDMDGKSDGSLISWHEPE